MFVTRIYVGGIAQSAGEDTIAVIITANTEWQYLNQFALKPFSREVPESRRFSLSSDCPRFGPYKSIPNVGLLRVLPPRAAARTDLSWDRTRALSGTENRSHHRTTLPVPVMI